jgi:hypothetical protein
MPVYHFQSKWLMFNACHFFLCAHLISVHTPCHFFLCAHLFSVHTPCHACVMYVQCALMFNARDLYPTHVWLVLNACILYLCVLLWTHTVQHVKGWSLPYTLTRIRYSQFLFLYTVHNAHFCRRSLRLHWHVQRSVHTCTHWSGQTLGTYYYDENSFYDLVWPGVT